MMILKKIFAVVIAIMMFCTTIISANAANMETQTDDIYDTHTNIKVARTVYTLMYDSSMNCVRATNAIYYSTLDIHASQRNFPGFIYMDVVLSKGSDDDWTADYLTTAGTYAAFSLEGDPIPAGKTLTSASAYFETNRFVSKDITADNKDYYANTNFTDAYTEHDLVIP